RIFVVFLRSGSAVVLSLIRRGCNAITHPVYRLDHRRSHWGKSHGLSYNLGARGIWFLAKSGRGSRRRSRRRVYIPLIWSAARPRQDCNFAARYCCCPRRLVTRARSTLDLAKIQGKGTVIAQLG